MDWSYLTIGNVISCTDATEDRVDESDVNRNGRHMATSLRHDCKKRVLSQKCTNFVCREIFFEKNAIAIGPFSTLPTFFRPYLVQLQVQRLAEEWASNRWRQMEARQFQPEPLRLSDVGLLQLRIADRCEQLTILFCQTNKQTNKQVRRFAPKLYIRFAFFLPGRT